MSLLILGIRENAILTKQKQNKKQKTPPQFGMCPKEFISLPGKLSSDVNLSLAVTPAITLAVNYSQHVAGVKMG